VSAPSLGSLRFRLTKRFGAKTVLQDFALEVRGRQFVTLLGPSGCGKSTALNIVAGLIPATAPHSCRAASSSAWPSRGRWSPAPT
jgi:ABC-type nitrate/sulfonate/bicarbonate transport system ATPase subunit